MKEIIMFLGVLIFTGFIVSIVSLLIGWVITGTSFKEDIIECMAGGWCINTVVLSLILTLVFFNI